MNKTKKKIILAAIGLFNQKGLTNVRNSDIAEEAGISLSNFNYHFGAKKELVFAVMDYMVETLEHKVYGNRMLVQEGQGLVITKSYFEFEQEFCFFYLDTQNILQTYPELKENIRKQIDNSLQIIRNLNYMSIGMGMMIPEPVEKPGLYTQLAEQIWVNNHFLMAQMRIRGLEGDMVAKGIDTLYSIQYPYLTEKGRSAYEAFIGTLAV